MELLFREQTSGASEPPVDEIEWANIALSCHLALDVVCCKEGIRDFA